MKSDVLKGYFFALIATLAFSNVYIFSKAALNEVHLAQFGIYWFSIGTVLNLLMAAKNKKLSQIKNLKKKQFQILILLGILEILTTTTFFISIKIIPDPAITSFLGNMYPVFLTIGGIFFLNEKFGWIEIIGAVLALAGAFIISYAGGTTLKTLFIEGAGIVAINAFFAASASLAVKMHVKRMSPEFINLNRSIWLLTFSFVIFLITKQSFIIPLSALKNIAFGAILGPFLAVLTVYYSFHFIDASRSSVVQSLKGLFVLVGTYLFFKIVPLPHQLIGGFITILGVLIMTMAHSGIFRMWRRT